MKKLSLTLMIVLFCVFSYGQVFESSGSNDDTEPAKSNVMDAIRAPIDGAYTKVHLSKYKPIDLSPIREADVLWSQLIWSVIDLREKFNEPLYFPVESKGNWKSFMQAILDATTDSSEANAMPIRVYDDEYVTIPYTVEGLKESSGTTTIQPLLNEWGEDTGQQVLFIPWGAKEVFQYVIKDQYIVEKQRSIMEPRLLVVCPMFWYEPVTGGGYQSYEENSDDDDDMQAVSPRKWRKFGWMYFPEMRQMLSTTEIFNPQNNAQRRTYDDVFMQRRFSSFVRAEENMYNNRDINEYIVNGMDQRLEGDKIREKIRFREHEMWEF